MACLVLLQYLTEWNKLHFTDNILAAFILEEWMRTLCSIHVGRTRKLWHFSPVTLNFKGRCESYWIGICCLNWAIFDAADSLHGVQLSLRKTPASSVNVLHSLYHLKDFKCLLVGTWMTTSATSTSHNTPDRPVVFQPWTMDRHMDRQVNR